MTLHEATRKCLEYFGPELPERFRWREGQKCWETRILGEFWCDKHRLLNCPIEIQMPEPSDELAMALARIGKRFELELLVTTHDGEIRWQCRAFLCDVNYDGTEVYADDPRDAIILACAKLISKEVP